MIRHRQMIPHGSGPSTARGRVALARTLAPALAGCARNLRLGVLQRLLPINAGSHHIVWRAKTDTGVYALRAAVALGLKPHIGHAKRERLWRAVGRWGVAPLYRGSVRIRIDGFDGWIEAFEWISGRHLRAAADGVPLAQTLATLHARSRGSRLQLLPQTPAIPFIASRLREFQSNERATGAIETLLRQHTAHALAELAEIRAIPRPSVIVHNDLVDANVLKARDRVWLIDWDWAMVTQPCMDLYCYLSPFVRSWGLQPRFLMPREAASFISTYVRCAQDHGVRFLLGTQAQLWRPYNTLLANWLYHNAGSWPHTRRSEFYRQGFECVEQLSEVIAGFK